MTATYSGPTTGPGTLTLNTPTQGEEERGFLMICFFHLVWQGEIRGELMKQRWQLFEGGYCEQSMCFLQMHPFVLINGQNDFGANMNFIFTPISWILEFLRIWRSLAVCFLFMIFLMIYRRGWNPFSFHLTCRVIIRS